METVVVSNVPQTLLLGRAGEYGVRELVFDLSPFVSSFGEGRARLSYRRPSEDKWWCVPLDVEDGVATWVVSKHATFLSGRGELELLWKVEGGLAKSVKYPTVVKESGRRPCPVPPEPACELLQRIEELEARVSALEGGGADAEA